MTGRRVPEESRRQEQGSCSHTRSSMPGPVPLLLSHRCRCCAGQRHLGAGRRLAALCPCLRARSAFCIYPAALCAPHFHQPWGGGHLCCSGKPSKPSLAGDPPRSSQGNLLQHRPARKPTSLFLLELDSRNRVFPPATLPPVHRARGQPGALPSASTPGPGLSEPGSRWRQSPPALTHPPPDPTLPRTPFRAPGSPGQVQQLPVKKLNRDG